VLSIAFAGKGQEQDTGAKIIHAASNTSSTVTSKSISKDGGVASYRGMVKVGEGLQGIRSRVVCDALIVDPRSTSNTWPTMEVLSDDVAMEHEARVSKIGDEQLFYLQSRGLGEAEASAMIVNGFLDPLVKQLPMEYAVELNRLIELEMEGSVGCRRAKRGTEHARRTERDSPRRRRGPGRGGRTARGAGRARALGRGLETLCLPAGRPRALQALRRRRPRAEGIARRGRSRTERRRRIPGG
ncbi:MAG TPA: SufD family Fe-S cluster assembly protein, partial [Spirochaetales bacterium]|nr:SufD family Fe-S cluster assembly protein [Spirochaetales bacterium]